jgi:hypothetical protein
MRLLLLEESHAGGLMGHFGCEKTLLMLADHFYWPKMRRDVDRFVRRCITCHRSKSKLKPHGLYTPLPAPATPWADISMDFVLGLLGYLFFLLGSRRWAPGSAHHQRENVNDGPLGGA